MRASLVHHERMTCFCMSEFIRAWKKEFIKCVQWFTTILHKANVETRPNNHLLISMEITQHRPGYYELR